MWAFGDKIPLLKTIVKLDKYSDKLYQDIMQDPHRVLDNLLTDDKACDEDFVIALLKISFFSDLIESKLEKCSSFWDLVWQNLGNSLFKQKFPLHPYLNSFTLLRGKQLYFEFSQKIKELEDCPEDLRESLQEQANINLWYAATKFSNYQAIDYLCWELVADESRLSELQSRLEIINLAKKAANIYLTPGYILYAKILNYCSVKLSDSDPQEKLMLYAHAYVALEKAESLFESSSDFIKIAYNFKTFSSIFSQYSSFVEPRMIIFNSMRTVLKNINVSSGNAFFQNLFVNPNQEVFSYIENVRAKNRVENEMAGLSLQK